MSLICSHPGCHCTEVEEPYALVHRYGMGLDGQAAYHPERTMLRVSGTSFLQWPDPPREDFQVEINGRLVRECGTRYTAFPEGVDIEALWETGASVAHYMATALTLRKQHPESSPYQILRLLIWVSMYEEHPQIREAYFKTTRGKANTLDWVASEMGLKRGGHAWKVA